MSTAQLGSTSVKGKKCFSSSLRPTVQTSSYSRPLFEGAKEFRSVFDCVQALDRHVRHDETSIGYIICELLGVVHSITDTTTNHYLMDFRPCIMV
jgi:hypothetical protein